MRLIVAAALVVAGIIHLLPLSGMLGSSQLAALYGLNIDEPNLALLMRHRAVLFGLLGLFLLVAAFRPNWQPAALLAGLISVVAFLLLAWPGSGYNAQIARVIVADWVALGCLLGGLAAYARMRLRA
ncbi:hypothetical protein DFR29_114148 [Tahibacter aquaticus]|uniref:Phosphopantetheine adenylyltransferase n=1 Tax=Tahibacter aquaticus TaxID=520092 RepID=A0A4R6YQI3_9GAMM|nr:phosphopantetheine adenylyltransferase [Tahibacter aquaticus]TDR40096.1 hypothetical protein DFR29_114148 [Tahibacter aquaticus]